MPSGSNGWIRCCPRAPVGVAEVSWPGSQQPIITALGQRLAGALRPLDCAANSPCNSEELDGLLPAHCVLRPAAVLIGLVPRSSGWQLLLTRRALHLPQHPGQISFPGGGLERDDHNAIAAALRETHEELGIAPERVQALGLLDVYATISAYAVTPVVALLDPGFELVPDPREVDEAFEVPLRFVLDRRNLLREEREFRGRLRGYYVYRYGEHYIWGATAGMLANLLDRLQRHGIDPADLDH